jgi:photosystem I subunit 4
MIKRNSIVKILRKESFWYNKTGNIVTIDESPTNEIKYPALVRFQTFNYSGINNANFKLNELVEILESEDKIVAAIKK